MEPAEVEAFRRQAVRVLARRAQARAAMGEGAAAVEDYVEACKWVCSLPSCLHIQQNTKKYKYRKMTFVLFNCFLLLNLGRRGSEICYFGPNAD